MPQKTCPVSPFNKNAESLCRIYLLTNLAMCCTMIFSEGNKRKEKHVITTTVGPCLHSVPPNRSSHSINHIHRKSTSTGQSDHSFMRYLSQSRYTDSPHPQDTVRSLTHEIPISRITHSCNTHFKVDTQAVLIHRTRSCSTRPKVTQCRELQAATVL